MSSGGKARANVTLVPESSARERIRQGLVWLGCSVDKAELLLRFHFGDEMIANLDVLTALGVDSHEAALWAQAVKRGRLVECLKWLLVKYRKNEGITNLGGLVRQFLIVSKAQHWEPSGAELLRLKSLQRRKGTF